MENTEKQNVGEWFVFGEYKVEKLMDGLYALDDGKDSSFYVLEGSQKAAVIDTGMGDGDVMPVIRQMTSLPCELLITHAHGDHMMHSGEFEKRYMSSKDIPVVLEFVKSIGMDPVLGTLEYTAFDREPCWIWVMALLWNAWPCTVILRAPWAITVKSIISSFPATPLAPAWACGCRFLMPCVSVNIRKILKLF